MKRPTLPTTGSADLAALACLLVGIDPPAVGARLAPLAGGAKAERAERRHLSANLAAHAAQLRSYDARLGHHGHHTSAALVARAAELVACARNMMLSQVAARRGPRDALQVAGVPRKVGKSRKARATSSPRRKR